jgi:mRNA interferase MazF
MIFNPWDVVVVPFPFSDSAESKRRKAFVLSKPRFQNGSGTLVLAMITSAQASSWPGDVKLADLAVAGLHKECFARLKIFTIDEQLVIERAGQLSKKDQVSIHENWQALLAL